ARPLLNQALENQNFDELVDPRLEKNYVQVEMFRMIEAAAACIRHLAPKRPKMSQVVRALDSIVEFTTDLSNGMKPGQSEIFDSREHVFVSNHHDTASSAFHSPPGLHNTLKYNHHLYLCFSDLMHNWIKNESSLQFAV
nr:proline-rich receptor-like protein kinase PERK8 [Tanacetum cinerariifolium]